VSFEKRLRISLFSLRLGVFIVMIMWTIDKFINPDHAAKVFKHFYMFDGLTHNLSYIVGFIQLVIVLCFAVGAFKKWSYGALLIFHAVSTLSTWNMYFDPWAPRNLLFFTAWPMLAAIFALYLLREKDTISFGLYLKNKKQQ